MENKLEILNPDDEFYYDSQLWRVGIYPGAGAELKTFLVYAPFEEKALEIAVANAEQNAPGLLSDFDAVRNDIYEYNDDDYKEWLFDNYGDVLEYDDAWFEFATNHLNYIYVDATEEGASQPYFITGDNLSIERVDKDELMVSESKEESNNEIKPGIVVRYDSEYCEPDERGLYHTVVEERSEAPNGTRRWLIQTLNSGSDLGNTEVVDEYMIKPVGLTIDDLTESKEPRKVQDIIVGGQILDDKTYNEMMEYCTSIVGSKDECIAELKADEKLYAPELEKAITETAGDIIHLFFVAMKEQSEIDGCDIVIVGTKKDDDSHSTVVDKKLFSYDNEKVELKKEALDYYNQLKIGDKLYDGKNTLEITDMYLQNQESKIGITITCKITGDGDERETTFHDNDILRLMNKSEIEMLNENVSKKEESNESEEHIIWDSEFNLDDMDLEDIKTTRYQDYLDNFIGKVVPMDYEEWLDSDDCASYFDYIWEEMAKQDAYYSEWYEFITDGVSEEEKKDAYEEYVERCNNTVLKPKEFEAWLADNTYELSEEHWEIAEEDLEQNILPEIDKQLNDNLLIAYGYYGSNYPEFASSGEGGKLFEKGTDDFRKYMQNFDRVQLTTENGQLGMIMGDHDGTVSGLFYTIPENKLELLKAMGYEERIKEDYSEEDLDRYNHNDLMETEFNNDVYYGGIEARDLTAHIDLLVPIKDTISGYAPRTPDPDGTKTESKDIITEDSNNEEFKLLVNESELADVNASSLLFDSDTDIASYTKGDYSLLLTTKGDIRILDNKEDSVYKNYQQYPDDLREFLRASKTQNDTDRYTFDMTNWFELFLDGPDGEILSDVSDVEGLLNGDNKVEQLENYMKEMFNDYVSQLDENKSVKTESTQDEIYELAKNTNIKEWYTTEYPDDELGANINDVTFYDLFVALDTHKNVYDVLGVGDSMVRERVFKKLDAILEEPVGYCYDQWLLTEDKELKIESVNGMKNINGELYNNPNVSKEVIDWINGHDDIGIVMSDNNTFWFETPATYDAEFTDKAHDMLIAEIKKLYPESKYLYESVEEDDEDEELEDDTNPIVVEYWETEEDREEGLGSIDSYYPESKIADAIERGSKLIDDMGYAAVEVFNQETERTYYLYDDENGEQNFGVEGKMVGFDESLEIKTESAPNKKETIENAIIPELTDYILDDKELNDKKVDYVETDKVITAEEFDNLVALIKAEIKNKEDLSNRGELYNTITKKYLKTESKHKQEQGKCPNCGNEELEYSETELEGNSYGYHWDCNECGASGIEWYNMYFSEIVSNHGDTSSKEEGNCPDCGEFLEYGSLVPDGMDAFYEVNCPECDFTGKEWYDLTFDEHEYNVPSKKEESNEIAQDHKQEFIDYCQGKVVDLGEMKVHDRTEEYRDLYKVYLQYDNLEISWMDEPIKNARVIIADDISSVCGIVDETGAIVTELGEDLSPHYVACEMNFSKIDKDLYEMMLDGWDGLYLNDNIQVHKDGANSIFKESVEQEPLTESKEGLDGIDAEEYAINIYDKTTREFIRQYDCYETYDEAVKAAKEMKVADNETYNIYKIMYDENGNELGVDTVESMETLSEAKGDTIDNATKHTVIGEIKEDGAVVKEFFGQGYVYKNYANYFAKSGPCYISEYQGEPDGAFHVNIDSDELSTKNFNDMVEGEDYETYNTIQDTITKVLQRNDIEPKPELVEKVAMTIFENVDWQSIEVLADEYIMDLDEADKKELIGESKLIEESTGTITHELHTDLVPILNMNQYQVSDGFDISSDELDSVMKDIGEPIITDEITKVFPSAQVSFGKFDHPPYYRAFSNLNDTLDFTVTVSAEEYEAKKQLVENTDEFAAFLKDRYKSYDGFISHMADNLKDFQTQDDWKQFVSVLTYFLTPYENQESFLLQVYDFIAENYGLLDEMDDEEILEENAKYDNLSIEDCQKQIRELRDEIEQYKKSYQSKSMKRFQYSFFKRHNEEEIAKLKDRIETLKAQPLTEAKETELKPLSYELYRQLLSAWGRYDEELLNSDGDVFAGTEDSLVNETLDSEISDILDSDTYKTWRDANYTAEDTQKLDMDIWQMFEDLIVSGKIQEMNVEKPQPEESIEEQMWTAVCSDDQEFVKNAYAQKLIIPNTRYEAGSGKHSFIMGALRNRNYEMVDLLKSLGERILKVEVDEYKNEMAKRTYEDEITKTAMEESNDIDDFDMDESESKWSEIRAEYFDDEENVYFVDAWVSSEDEEEGTVIAKVNPDTKEIIYLDDDAKTDSYAQEIINELLEENKSLTETVNRYVINKDLDVVDSFGGDSYYSDETAAILDAKELDADTVTKYVYASEKDADERELPIDSEEIWVSDRVVKERHQVEQANLGAKAGKEALAQIKQVHTDKEELRTALQNAILPMDEEDGVNGGRTQSFSDDYIFGFNDVIEKELDSLEENIFGASDEVIADSKEKGLYTESEDTTGWLGIKGAEYIWRGEWSDPQVAYKGYIFNYWDITESVAESMNAEYEERGEQAPDDMDVLHKYMEENPGVVENALYDLRPDYIDKRIMEELRQNYTFDGLVENLTELKTWTSIPEEYIDNCIKLANERKAGTDMESSFDEEERVDELLDEIEEILSVIPEI